ncbi:MAG: type II CAAX prenyl endopeptidase Rce1 family protein [Phycisphaerales bacterium JB052]
MTEPARKPAPLLRLCLIAEFIGLYILIPPIVAGFIRPAMGDTMLRRLGITGITFDVGLPGGLFVFPLLIFTFVSMFIYLRIDPTFDNTNLWGWSRFKRDFKRIITQFVYAASVLLLIAWVLAWHTDIMPVHRFLFLPREAPGLMLAITLLYPWMSAYPQEITHRAFFFHRYRSILGEGRLASTLNVLAFSWLHITMWNWVALVMTLPAGVLFAYTYKRSDSALAAGFEHAIYGVWVFFVGLGYFVFTGNAAQG